MVPDMKIIKNMGYVKSTLAQMFNDRVIVLSQPTDASTDRPLIIAGYASVSVVDSENHIIPVSVLVPAMKSFMAQPEFRNVMVEHSSLQVGSVIEEYKAENGRTYRTGVDENGLFVVVKIRSAADLSAISEVREAIVDGRLRSFSIAGIAKAGDTLGDSSILTLKSLELFEITICKQGKNPLAKFDVIAKAMNSGFGSFNLSQVVTSRSIPVLLKSGFISSDVSAPNKLLVNGEKTGWFDGVIRQSLVADDSFDVQYVDSTTAKPLYDLMLIPATEDKRALLKAYFDDEVVEVSRDQLAQTFRSQLLGHLSYQRSLLRKALTTPPTSYRELEQTLIQVLDRSWSTYQQNTFTHITNQAVAVGKSLADSPDTLFAEADVVLPIKVGDDTLVASFMHNTLDTFVSSMRQRILDNAYIHRASMQDIPQVIDTLFASWLDTDDTVQTFSQRYLHKAFNIGLAIGYGENGSATVKVQNASPCTCSECSRLQDQVCSIGYAIAHANSNTFCVQTLIDMQDTLPTIV